MILCQILHFSDERFYISQNQRGLPLPFASIHRCTPHPSYLSFNRLKITKECYQLLCRSAQHYCRASSLQREEFVGKFQADGSNIFKLKCLSEWILHFSSSKHIIGESYCIFS